MRTLPGAGPSQLLQRQAGDASGFEWGVLINGPVIVNMMRTKHLQDIHDPTLGPSFSPKLLCLTVIWHLPGGLLLQFVALSVTPEFPFHAKRCVWFLSPSYVAVFTHPPFISGLKQQRRQIVDARANEAIPD